MNHTKKKILILGATGMLGHQFWRKLNAYAYVKENYEIWGTIRKTKASLSHNQVLHDLFNSECIIENFDTLDFNHVFNTLSQIKPDIIINCIGITLRKPELHDIEICYKLNGFLPQFLAHWADQFNSKVIHFSTDCVFNGKKGSSYTESDAPSALDVYGISKYLGELRHGNHLTLRLSIVGREILNHSEMFEWFFSQKNKTTNGYTQVFYTGLTTAFVVREVARILEKHLDLSGVYQVASEKKSKFEILQQLNLKFNLNVNLQPFSDIVSDKALDCTKYKKITSFQQPSWSEMIDDLYEDRAFYESLKG